ncbi:MAG: hypothetical protein IT492_02925 [Gammaproteobacteria bacterium]|nr:hypothetical protein [Gammaproteobacteria bacterium]
MCNSYRAGRALLLACLVIRWAAAHSATEDHHNNVGQSVAHPVSRFDLRVRYMAFEGDSEAQVLEARLEHPFDLAGGWKLNTRAVMSGGVTDFPSRDNRAGDYSAGTGDLYTQLFFIAPSIGDTSIGFGWRNYFPTAGEDQFGKGKYRFAPLVVVQRMANWLSPGSFYGLGIRNDFSVAGDRAHRDVNELQVVPVVTVMLPQQSFVTLFPEIVIDWQQDNRVFVPFDLEIGRKYAAHQVGSVRVQLPLINELHTYEWTMELRWSLFF